MNTTGQSHSMNYSTASVEMPDQARQQHAMNSFARNFGALSALQLEACIHCGMCADACHFFIATEDPKYTPILKVEPFKQAYKREAGAFAPLYRLLGLKRKVTADELEQWQELLFDSCNLCGRCSLICPMGIDVASLIEDARAAMFEAGLAPNELYRRARNQNDTGRPEEDADGYADRIAEIGRSHGVEIPVDRASAEVLACVPRTDLERYPEAVAALAKTLAHLGADYTFRGDALVAENYGYYAGGRDWQRRISMRIIEQAKAIGAKLVLVPECGHAYTALRWQAAELAGERLPFKVRHVTEYLAEQVADGKLRLNRVDDETTAFHDPCQLVRKGGVMDAPRTLMRELGVNLEELPNNKGFSFCCAGGGGVNDLERARPLRYRAQELKLREVDGTGAGRFLTSCSDCRLAFSDAAEHFDWDKRPESLLELVAANIKE